MSINNISSSSTIYDSLLKKMAAATTGDNAYAKSTQPTIDTSTVTKQPSQQDIKALLSRLAGVAAHIGGFFKC